MTVEIEDDGDLDAPENKEGEASEDKNEYENAILVVATLIITLTYQAVLNPPSTLLQLGGTIDWSCLPGSFFNSQDFAYPGINVIKRCPARLAFWFLMINTIVFILSIFLLLSSLRGGHRVLLNILRLLALFLTSCYCVLLEAFSYHAAYVASPIYWLTTIYFIFVNTE